MRLNQFHVGQSLEGVQQFLAAHADVLQSVNASDARKQLDATVTQLRATAAEQDLHARELKGVRGTRVQLEAALVKRFMTPLSKWARANLQGEPALGALSPSAGQLRRQKLVVTAEGMLEAAGTYSARLTTGSFPPDFLERFRAAIDAVQGSLGNRKGSATAKSGATKSIAALLRQGRMAVTALDALVTHQILGDARLEREWAVAKRVRRSASPAAATPVTPQAQEVTTAAA
jgi:hypothetical protein